MLQLKCLEDLKSVIYNVLITDYVYFLIIYLFFYSKRVQFIKYGQDRKVI